MTQYDIAVIGAGVAGLSAAYFLSAGAHVVVLERESQPAYHSSGRSAALYIEGYENPVVAGLTGASGAFFREPPVDLSQAPLLHPRGGLTVAGPGEVDALNRYLERWQPFCKRLRPVDREEILDLCPILRRSWLTGGGYDPDWQAIDTHELMSLYARGIRHNGSDVRTSAEVTDLKHQSGKWLVSSATESYSADLVVNASGAWANQLASLAELEALPLSPLRRTAAIIPAPEQVRHWPVVHTISGNLYFKPESPGLMVSPQDETPSPPMDAYAEELDVAIALDRLGEIADLEVRQIAHQWAGLRTFAPDRFPVLGRDPRAAGFFWLAGQGGFGVQTSPELGRLTAAAILRDEPLADDIHVTRLL